MDLHTQNLLASFVVVFLISLFNSTNIYYTVLLMVNIFIIYFIFLMCLNFDFIAQAFLIIYAGAVVILFLLVIMLFDAPKPAGPVLSPETNFYSLSKTLLFIFSNVLFLTLIFYFLTKYYLFFSVSSHLHIEKSFVHTPLTMFFNNTNIVNLGNHMFNFFYLELLILGQLFIIIILGISLYFKKDCEHKAK